eukprot:s1917_g13.t1
MQPLYGIGDISFYSNDKGLQDDFEGWCTNSYPYKPVNFDDILAQDFVTWICQTAENQVATSLISQAAFPSTEGGDGGTFDQIESPQDFALMDPSEEAITEETQLDELDIPGLPVEESERRAKWRAVPQRIRVAIRRLHRQFGHCPKKVLVNLLRTAKVDKSYIDAANFHRCNQCEDAQPRRNAHTVSLQERYSFSHALGVDVFECLDASGTKYQVMNFVCLGTCFQLAEIVREGDGLPSSARCLEAIQRRWACWAGMSTVLQCDRGLHNRIVLAQFCAAHGIQVSHAPLETPEAIGRVERHGGALKAKARKVVAQTQAVGQGQLQTVLDEFCLTKNSMLRHGGYSPSQWVLGKTPRGPPSFMEEEDLGSLEDQANPESVPPEDAEEQEPEDVDVEPAPEDDDGPSGLLDGLGPLASIFEDDVAEEQAERGRSRSPPPVAAARSRRTSVLEPDAERTPSRRSSRNDLLDDLPASIRATFEQRRVEEEANVSIRKKLKGFWSNRLSTKEQVEQELKDLPEAYDPEFKSRLVSCGNFEDSTEIGTDAPTSDLETHALVSAFAASNGVPVESSDIRNAYFQAEPIDRVVLMRQPTGGLPGVDPEAILLIRVPVYGLCDSGRGFWRKVDREARSVGFQVSRIFPAFYFYREKGKVVCVLTTHVDDFLWASIGTGGTIIDKLLKKFEVGRRESGRLRFRGKQFDKSGNDVLIDVIDNTNKITYIDIKPNRKHSDLIDRGEERQLRSVVGSLSWISRQARPDILYRVSKLQRSIKGATIATLHEANKVLEMALKGRDLKLRSLARTAVGVPLFGAADLEKSLPVLDTVLTESALLVRQSACLGFALVTFGLARLEVMPMVCDFAKMDFPILIQGFASFSPTLLAVGLSRLGLSALVLDFLRGSGSFLSLQRPSRCGPTSPPCGGLKLGLLPAAADADRSDATPSLQSPVPCVPLVGVARLEMPLSAPDPLHLGSLPIPRSLAWLAVALFTCAFQTTGPLLPPRQLSRLASPSPLPGTSRLDLFPSTLDWASLDVLSSLQCRA